MSTPHSKPSPKRAKPGFHKLNKMTRTIVAATEKNIRVTFSWLYWYLQGTLTLNQCTFGLHYLCGFRFTEYFFQSNPTLLHSTRCNAAAWKRQPIIIYRTSCCRMSKSVTTNRTSPEPKCEQGRCISSLLPIHCKKKLTVSIQALYIFGRCNRTKTKINPHRCHVRLEWNEEKWKI